MHTYTDIDIIMWICINIYRERETECGKCIYIYLDTDMIGIKTATKSKTR